MLLEIELQTASDNIYQRMPDPSIQVTGLTKVYTSLFSRKPIPALTDLNLTVEAGEIFGLLGPNGAGKTTLVKILLSIVHPTSGKAALFGQSVTKPRARRCIGFLPENHRFPDFLTPDQMLNLYGRLAGVPDDLRKKRVPELLEMVNMSEWRHVKIKKFSKGMMQRIGLAQVMMNDPDLIFLDEPTDGVDPIGRREIRDILFVLKDQGKTIFLNSHLLSEVEQMCTSVAILNKGKKIREGSVEDLTRTETHFDLKITPLDEGVLSRLSDRFELRMVSPATNGNLLQSLRLTDTNRSALNALIDELRQAGVEIESVQPVRQSLEERFMAEVKENSNGGQI